jgi:hypothetical protein
MKKSSSAKLIVICFTALLVLTACSGSTSPELTQAIVPQEVQHEETTPPIQSGAETTQEIIPTPDEINPPPLTGETEDGSIEDGSYPAPEDQALPGGYPPPADQPGGYPAPDGEPVGDPNPSLENPPPVKTGLEATDPSTVSLASGELQFIEFFAFW